MEGGGLGPPKKSVNLVFLWVIAIFDPYGNHMDLCNQLCLASWPAILHS